MIINGNGVYQKVISNDEELELYLAMVQAKFKEELPQNVFENNNIIITIVNRKDIQLKTNIGNLKYYYENNDNASCNFMVHLYVVSKIVNSKCIYNIDNGKAQQQAEIKDMNDNYDKKIDDIDNNTFSKENEGNKEEQSSNKNTNKDNTLTKQISSKEADQIAEKGFKEAERIVGQYSKDTQEVKTEEVYENNFFTRKSYETDIVYNNKPKTKCYVYTRTDDMLNGVSIYIDINTGKIVGGKAFGD